MFKKLNIPIIGIIQNMSIMKCSKCSHENHIFGNSVQKLAEQEGNYNYLVCNMSYDISLVVF